jgi:hypothetical protein
MKVHFQLSGIVCMRLKLGLTQQQLAISLGISRPALALAETGRRAIPERSQLLLRDMMLIAASMPHPADSGKERRIKKSGEPPRRTHNRVSNGSRLYTVTKKRFVTAQSSTSIICTRPAMTRHASGNASVRNFSTHLLQSPFDCRQLLDGSAIKKARLQGWLAYRQLEARAAVIRGQELTAELTYVNTMLQVNQEIIENYPHAAAKRKLEHRNAKLHCKRLVLEDRLEHFDAAAMVLREYNINVVVKQLELLEELIAAVEKRKGELEGMGMHPSFLLVEKEGGSGKDDDGRIITGGKAGLVYQAA